MKPINYPADFDAAVAAALAHPCFIDSRGNLYMLRNDGATVLVAGPEAGTNVQFQGMGSSQQMVWATTQERIFVRFNENGQCLQATLPRARGSGYLPEYRRSFMAWESPSSVYAIHNTEDTCYCFDIAPEGMRLCAEVKGYKGLGAWIAGHYLYVFGMRTRIHRDTKATFDTAVLGFWVKQGLGALLRIDLSTGRVHIESANDAKKALVAAWMAEVGESDDRYARPLLEAWLGSVETEQRRVLIGGIADHRPSEWDLVSEEPRPPDFVGIALYRWREGKKVELLRLLRGVRYIGRMEWPGRALLYFVKREDPRDVLTDRHFAMQVSPDMQSPLLPVVFDWAKENLWTVQFDCSYDEHVGAIAAVTTKTGDAPLPYQRHLAMSDDGLAWRFVHALPGQLI